MPNSEMERHRSIFIAAALSLVPGLGHFYVGAARRGFLLPFLAGLIILGFRWTGALLHYRGLAALTLITLALPIVAAIDSAWLAHGRKNYELKDYNQWYVYVAIAIVFGFSLSMAPRFLPSMLGIAIYRHQGQWMEPAIRDGSTVVLDLMHFRKKPPEPGDLVAFHWPQSPTKFTVSRVVAIGQERVALKDGQLVVNGADLDEPYVDRRFSSKFPQTMGEKQIPDGEFFVLNDRRDLGPDSRHSGNVQVDALIGKVAIVIQPDATHVDLIRR